MSEPLPHTGASKHNPVAVNFELQDLENELLHNRFYTYKDKYEGHLAHDDFGVSVYGFDGTVLDELNVSLPKIGAVWGFLAEGSAQLQFDGHDLSIEKNTWFITEAGLDIWLSDDAKLLAIQKEGYRGMDVLAKLQPDGRLKYINGAFDTVLFGPLKFGEPILNALYMVPGIHQTMHTHPSTRAGMIISGHARAETPEAVYDLLPGTIFFMEPNGRHKFRTDETDNHMVLIAWHPDSLFGPKDEDHPMLNRTIVAGKGANEEELAAIRTK